MTPATILLIVQGLQAAISAAPQVEALVVKAKDYVAELFNQGLISKVQQDTIHSHLDQVCDAALRGETPLELTIEADPV